MVTADLDEIPTAVLEKADISSLKYAGSVSEYLGSLSNEVVSFIRNELRYPAATSSTLCVSVFFFSEFGSG